jgi:hypothetical protein
MTRLISIRRKILVVLTDWEVNRSAGKRPWIGSHPHVSALKAKKKNWKTWSDVNFLAPENHPLQFQKLLNNGRMSLG